ncbi:hypothetical protein NP493_393g05046 [Ridgeia piscesae]|uniref:Shootin-1 n=1 Tax=Ridgeia piscesae TaxID=27915 RepID=A0AAD9L2W9_RIDPI|nr:hypothetical protein NP493_393g05046 [Ridgeia piscesae]
MYNEYDNVKSLCLLTVYEPVYNEYDKLNTVYKIEKECRSEAERYASKVNKQNKKLKRQSQHILLQLGTLDIDITEDDDGEGEGEGKEKVEEQQEHWNHMIDDLETQLAGLKSRLRQVEEEHEQTSKEHMIALQKLEAEKEAHKQTKAALQYYENSLKQFRRVSTRAYEEFNDLRDRYEKENVLKTEAEKYASKMLSERDAMARESSVLLASAASDERLMSALLEIETLTKDLAAERQQHNVQVTGLEEMLASCQDQTQIRDLEKQVELATEESESLRKQVIDLQKWQQTLEQQNTDLTQKLDDAEEKLRPPPPPQAPPMPVGGIFQPLHNILKKDIKQKKDTSKLGGDVQRDPRYEDAIKEMMSRIQSGGNLRSVPKRDSQVSLRDSSASQTDMFAGQISRSSNRTDTFTEKPKTETKEKSAMADLHQILVSLKKGQLELSDSEPAQESELARTFNRIRGSQKEPNLSLITEEDEKETQNRYRQMRAARQ